jgi:hypothetical protein
MIWLRIGQRIVLRSLSRDVEVFDTLSACQTQMDFHKKRHEFHLAMPRIMPRESCKGLR